MDDVWTLNSYILLNKLVAWTLCGRRVDAAWTLRVRCVDVTWTLRGRCVDVGHTPFARFSHRVDVRGR